MSGFTSITVAKVAKAQSYTKAVTQHPIERQPDAINETSDYDFNQVTSSETVSDWYSYCREAVFIYMVEKMEPDGRIGGPNHVVEVDETKIGKRKYNVGRLKEGYWILGVIDRTTKDFRLQICPDNSRSSASLIPLIQKHVAEGSLIMTDQWAAYRSLPTFNYVHQTVNHSQNFVDPITGAHTQTVEGSWFALKRKLQDGGIRNCLADRLLEYLFRRTCAFDDVDTFSKMLDVIRHVYPL